MPHMLQHYIFLSKDAVKMFTNVRNLSVYGIERTNGYTPGLHGASVFALQDNQHLQTLHPLMDR